MEAETVERGYSLPEKTGLPKIHGLPTSSMYSTSSSGDYYAASPKYSKSKRSSHSGELQSPMHAISDSNGSGRPFTSGFYPSVDAWATGECAYWLVEELTKAFYSFDYAASFGI